MKNVFVFLLISAFTLPAATAFSQTTLSGKITDNNGDAIVGANVTLKNTYDGSSTNNDGQFSFSTAERDSQTLVVSYVGYETLEKRIYLRGAQMVLNVKLNEVVNELNMVEVSAGSFEASDGRRTTILTPLDIVTTAGAGGDTYGALQTLPGTQRVGNETGLFVRGGDASETKTFIDGVSIANPYFTNVPDIPQRGRFSPFLFKGTIFSTGGYSAQYGGAMSSAVILESQDLAELSTTSISLMSVGVGIGHHHLFAGKKTSLGVFASYTNLLPYYAIAPQHYHYDHAPESGSGSMIFRHKTSKTGIIKAFINWSPSRVEVIYPYPIDTVTGKYSFQSTDHNFFSQASYKELFAKHWTFFASASYSIDHTDVLLNDKDTVKQSTNLVQGRITISRPIGSLSSIRFGTEVQHPYFTDEFNGLKKSADDDYSAVYAEGDIYVTKSLIARAGARMEYSTLLKEGNLAPRISLAYKTGKISQVSFAYGQFYQQPGREYLYSQDNIQFQWADHYILNYQTVSNKRTFRVEGYYKQYHSLIKTLPDTASNGTGYARGVDIFFRDKKTIKHADYWISYSFLDSKRDYLYFPDEAVPSFAAKHTFTTVYKQFIPKINSSVSATYTFSTGRNYINPYNPVLPGKEIPDYNNLSLSYSYLTQIFQNFTVIAVGVGNVLGIDNTVAYRYINEGDPIEVKQPSLRSYFIGLFMTIGEDKGDDE